MSRTPRVRQPGRAARIAAADRKRLSVRIGAVVARKLNAFCGHFDCMRDNVVEDALARHLADFYVVPSRTSTDVPRLAVNVPGVSPAVVEPTSSAAA